MASSFPCTGTVSYTHLEPICEAKFHRYSYGFRPNRNCKQAVAMCYKLAQVNGYHYVVDVDIKGFFDHVHHGKLLKQLWSLGIQDKSLLRVISKMLKAPIEENGKRTVPQEGTPPVSYTHLVDVRDSGQISAVYHHQNAESANYTA